MAEINWTERATHNLDDIAAYIALVNPVAASRLVRKVMDSVDRLKDFPESGRYPPELNSKLHRELIITPCRLFYKHNADGIHILFIMRSEGDLKRYLIEESQLK
jgi:toxin ParE1/3/4